MAATIVEVNQNRIPKNGLRMKFKVTNDGTGNFTLNEAGAITIPISADPTVQADVTLGKIYWDDTNKLFKGTGFDASSVVFVEVQGEIAT